MKLEYVITHDTYFLRSNSHYNITIESSIDEWSKLSIYRAKK